MKWLPGARVEVANAAVPVEPSGLEPIVAVPSSKATVPPGTREPDGCVTVTVNVSDSPAVDGFDDEWTVVAVAAWLSRAETLFEATLAVTMSRAPSPLRSTAARASGILPVANGDSAHGTKAPLPSPIRTLTLLASMFADAMSSLPSRLKSARTMAAGPAFVGTDGRGAKPPEPFPSSTVTELDVWLETTRSCRPSPLRSPAAMADGLTPVATFDPCTNMPVPMARKIETEFVP